MPDQMQARIRTAVHTAVAAMGPEQLEELTTGPYLEIRHRLARAGGTS